MKKTKRYGMAIPLVLVFATALGIVATYLIKSTQQYNRSNMTSFAQLQAHFTARAGIEHAMLKIKFLHRELYDAICLAQGRNPLFDFTQVTDLNSPEAAIKPYNPGPIYLYRSGQFSPDRLFTPGFSMGGQERRWLDTFMSDIKSDATVFDGVSTNGVLSMKPLPANIKNRMREPFNLAEYGVTSLNIAAQEIAETGGAGASRVSNTAVVEIVVQSTVETARGEAWDYEIRKTVRINRD
jgi:hypothetical protein